MRFLVDMPLSPSLAHWLGERGHDAVHVDNVGLGRASDEQILERARQERRVIVTADLDYARLFALTGEEEAGLILLRGGNYSEDEARGLIGRAIELLPPEQISGAITVLDHWRIRRRVLPLGAE